MSVTRGAFLKSLGKSLPGLVLGSGATAAQKLLGKIAAAGEPGIAPAKIASTPAAVTALAPREMIQHGPSHGNRIALTFDDGPTPGVTDRILDELKRRDARATFFMIGERMVAAPDLARRVRDEGHEIGNHTFTHPKLNELSDAKAADEIQRTLDVMAEILGLRPVWFRPPYFALRPDQHQLVHDRGMRIVGAGVDPGDWAQPPADRIVSGVVENTKPGSIILCHDLHASTADASGRMLDGLIETGFTPVSLSVLMEGIDNATRATDQKGL